MNAAHLHLVFTHLPIVGLALAIFVNMFALLRKSDDVRKLTLWVYVVVGFFALLAYFTGDGAEKLLETYPGYGEEQIRPHENMAILLFIGLMLMAAIALIGLYVGKNNKILLKRFCIILFICALAMSYFAYETGSTGGAIRHTEIEKGYYKN